MSDLDQSTPVQQRDDFTLLYALLFFPFFLLFAFSDQLDRAFNLYLLMAPAMMAVSLLVPASFLCLLAVNLIRRRWWKATSVLLAPVLAVCPFILCAAIGITPAWVRFQFERAHYQEQVEQDMEAMGTPRLRTFDYGMTGGVGTAVTSYSLVYDESDELSLPYDSRSAAWKARASLDPRLQSVVTGTNVLSIRSLGHHFYEVAEAY